MNDILDQNKKPREKENQNYDFLTDTELAKNIKPLTAEEIHIIKTGTDVQILSLRPRYGHQDRKYFIAKNANASEKLLSQRSNDPDQMVRFGVSQNEGISQQLKDKLARDSEVLQLMNRDLYTITKNIKKIPLDNLGIKEITVSSQEEIRKETTVPHKTGTIQTLTKIVKPNLNELSYEREMANDTTPEIVSPDPFKIKSTNALPSHQDDDGYGNYTVPRNIKKTPLNQVR